VVQSRAPDKRQADARNLSPPKQRFGLAEGAIELDGPKKVETMIAQSDESGPQSLRILEPESGRQAPAKIVCLGQPVKVSMIALHGPGPIDFG
jgi:hypothetical protein